MWLTQEKTHSIPSAFVVASLTALLAYSCGSAGMRLLPDVVLAAWVGYSSAACPVLALLRASSSEQSGLGIQWFQHQEAFAKNCYHLSSGSL